MAITMHKLPAQAQSEPASRKTYVQGSRPDVRVPVREIRLAPSAPGYGGGENAPVRVYDTSGPHSDPLVTTDFREGVAPLRRPWILERDDVEEHDGRNVEPNDNGYRPGDPRANMEVFPGL